VSRSARDWLAILSIKWKDYSDRCPEDVEALNELFRFGLVECGCDVSLLGYTTGEVVEALYVCTGDDWQTRIRERVRADVEFDERIHAAFECGSVFRYLRLSDAGIDVKRTGFWPENSVPFQAEKVDFFDERETEEELARYSEDEDVRSYIIDGLKTKPREIKAMVKGGLKFYRTEGMIRRRLTRAESSLLIDTGIECVSGEEHEDIQRALACQLFPDLRSAIVVRGEFNAMLCASNRLRKWTGVGMPGSHRGWRTLAECVGLTAEEITGKWLNDYLLPRLFSLWSKRPPKQRQEWELAASQPEETVEPDKPDKPALLDIDGLRSTLDSLLLDHGNIFRCVCQVIVACRDADDQVARFSELKAAGDAKACLIEVALKGFREVHPVAIHQLERLTGQTLSALEAKSGPDWKQRFLNALARMDEVIAGLRTDESGALNIEAVCRIPKSDFAGVSKARLNLVRFQMELQSVSGQPLEQVQESAVVDESFGVVRLDDEEGEASEAVRSSKRQGPPWPSAAPTDERYKFGPLKGNQTKFAKCADMDARTLFSNNGVSYFYIRRVARYEFEVWLDSDRKYAEWTASLMRMT
jgi:hypothetical protein